MKVMAIGMLTLALAGAACGGEKTEALEIPATGTQVTVQKRDGVSVAGRLVEVKPELVVVEQRDGKRTEVARREITSVNAGDAATGAQPNAAHSARPSSAKTVVPTGNSGEGNGSGESAPARAERERADAAPSFRELTIPAGTVLPLELKSTVASDTSNVEDPVRATLRRAVQVGGVQALPAGTAVLGHVTDASRAGRVKGRARVAFRFTEVTVPGSGRESIRTDVVAREAAASKKQDAAKIGAGAAGGAIVGGILGGGDGAAKGAAIGGAAGTGVVLSTRGKEVRLGPGADLSVRLTAPLTVRVPVR